MKTKAVDVLTRNIKNRRDTCRGCRTRMIKFSGEYGDLDLKVKIEDVLEEVTGRPWGMSEHLRFEPFPACIDAHICPNPECRYHPPGFNAIEGDWLDSSSVDEWVVDNLSELIDNQGVYVRIYAK